MATTVVVTGGAGFIGSALVRHLIRTTDWRIVNVDLLTYAGSLPALESAAESERHLFEHVDVADGAAVRRLLSRHQPDAVLHLAAESHVDRSIDGPAPFLRTNVQGTFTLLEAASEYWRELPEEARRRFRFLHVSTDEIYGTLGPGERFTEQTPYEPRSPYAASKAAADHLVRAWHATYGLPVLVTCSGNNYGPYQFPEKLIPRAILRALEGQSIPIYGDGGQVRDWLHVHDHVRALLLVLDRGAPGETYNVGGHGECTNLELVRQLCDHLDEERPRSDGQSHRERIAFVEDRPGHDRRYAIDPTRIERDLGWRPERSLREGLRETVRWYLEHEPWWRSVLEGRYRLERLGTRALGVGEAE